MLKSKLDHRQHPLRLRNNSLTLSRGLQIASNQHSQIYYRIRIVNAVIPNEVEVCRVVKPEMHTDICPNLTLRAKLSTKKKSCEDPLAEERYLKDLSKGIENII